MAWIVSLLFELVLGANLVCAEAHTLPEAGRIAVASSIANRAEETGLSPLEVMTMGRAYTRTRCPVEMVSLEHAEAYLKGKLGMGPAWTKDVHSFYHVRLDESLAETWTKRGLRKIKGHRQPRVVYWRKR